MPNERTPEVAETRLIIAATEPVDLSFHHGGLPPALGAQNFQVFRANHTGAETGEAEGWTYNHAPMLTHWRGRFYLQFLSNPRSEHVAPGRTLLTDSADGKDWLPPKVVFPVYALPPGGNDTLRAKAEAVPEFAVMHQRMGFFVSASGRLLTLGFYGFSPAPENLPFDQRGIGRVVREVFADGSFGPIHFIRFNRHAGWNEINTPFPFYAQSRDAGFVAACDELLADPLVVQQWKEEHGESDPLITLRGPLKAFSFYRRDDGSVIGLWKWALAGFSRNGGKSWDWIEKIPSLATAGGKIWGQRTADSRYALLYNPSTNNKHRWPLAMVTSDDGLSFSRMRVVAGHVSPTRYGGGRFKDFGQNYVRGLEGTDASPDGCLWFAYSMNKEDIWVGRVPLQPAPDLERIVDETFGRGADTLRAWNLFCPRWARAEIGATANGSPCLELRDRDPFDYVCAERNFLPAREVRVELRFNLAASGAKTLYIELWDTVGRIPVRMTLSPDGALKVHHGRRKETFATLTPGVSAVLSLRASTVDQRFEGVFNGEPLGLAQRYQGELQAEPGWLFLSPATVLSRVVLRTDVPRREPHLDSEVESTRNLSDSEKPVTTSVFQIESLRIDSVPT